MVTPESVEVISIIDELGVRVIPVVVAIVQTVKVPVAFSVQTPVPIFIALVLELLENILHIDRALLLASNVPLLTCKVPTQAAVSCKV